MALLSYKQLNRRVAQGYAPCHPAGPRKPEPVGTSLQEIFERQASNIAFVAAKSPCRAAQ